MTPEKGSYIVDETGQGQKEPTHMCHVCGDSEVHTTDCFSLFASTLGGVGGILFHLCHLMDVIRHIPHTVKRDSHRSTVLYQRHNHVLIVAPAGGVSVRNHCVN